MDSGEHNFPYGRNGKAQESQPYIYKPICRNMLLLLLNLYHIISLNNILKYVQINFFIHHSVFINGKKNRRLENQ